MKSHFWPDFSRYGFNNKVHPAPQIKQIMPADKRSHVEKLTAVKVPVSAITQFLDMSDLVTLARTSKEVRNWTDQSEAWKPQAVRQLLRNEKELFSQIQHAKKQVRAVHAHRLLKLCEHSGIPACQKKLSKLPKDLSLEEKAEKMRTWLKKSWRVQRLDTLSIHYTHGTEFTAVAKEISYFKNLKYLFLSKNELQLLPSSLATLKKLYAVVIDDNRLQELPDALLLHTTLRQLSAKGNNLNISDLSSKPKNPLLQIELEDTDSTNF